MPISQSAKKSLRVSARNHKVNVSFKTKLKNTIKEYLAKPSQDGLKKAFSMLDKAHKNNIYHQNKVARLKSEYSKKIESKVSAPAAKKKATKPTAKKVVKKQTKKM